MDRTDNCQDELISIIVPVYNTGLYLEECLESIQKQTYKNIEIILVYTPCKDNSLEICKDIEKTDTRFKLVLNSTGKRGPGISRNIGISFVKGKYIGFVDSDDVIAIDMYEHLYRNIKKFEAEISICKESRKISKIYSNKKGKIKILNRVEALQNLLEGRLYFAELWNKLYLFETVKEIKFLENVYSGEDIMYVWKAISQADRVIYSSEMKYFYRYNPCGLSKTYREEAVKEIKEIYNIIGEDIIENYNSLESIYRNRISIINAQNYMAFKMKKICDNKMENYLLSQRCNPSIKINKGKFPVKEILFALIYQIKPQLIQPLYKIYSRTHLRK